MLRNLTRKPQQAGEKEIGKHYTKYAPAHLLAARPRWKEINNNNDDQ